eukprot:CAMPEP_0113950752 /NCGR_PEP_ID=MMETSP1339-20121228/82410_1 /TAXON_ID=94617 /ORGANISM="Fibrocapsa japonica" /LENGTH=144 /DNA_ID=CAMNT_0000958709 /DNA_START=57 /DNA_END=489 /DNA_ORIENTATION=- /assembly_acc=CAM_ASM_000762
MKDAWTVHGAGAGGGAGGGVGGEEVVAVAVPGVEEGWGGGQGVSKGGHHSRVLHVFLCLLQIGQMACLSEVQLVGLADGGLQGLPLCRGHRHARAPKTQTHRAGLWVNEGIVVVAPVVAQAQWRHVRLVPRLEQVDRLACPMLG